MVPPALGPRVLLRRLREVMAEPDAAQQRLDRIVKLIAANMVAEVCSIYVLRPGGDLELFATEGLNRSAVHKSRLNLGEGLVGRSPRDGAPLNLADARSHPDFKYLPETGEEIYYVLPRRAAACGSAARSACWSCRTAPAAIYRGGRGSAADRGDGAGRDHRLGRPQGAGAGRRGRSGAPAQPIICSGESIAEGLALGHAVLHEPRVIITNLIAESIPDEKRRIEEGDCSAAPAGRQADRAHEPRRGRRA